MTERLDNTKEVLLMGRYSTSSAYDHRCRYLGDGTFAISWVVDRYYAGDRLRHPVGTTRHTDAVGAARFCNKHGITLYMGRHND